MYVRSVHLSKASCNINRLMHCPDMLVGTTIETLRTMLAALFTTRIPATSSTFNTLTVSSTQSSRPEAVNHQSVCAWLHARRAGTATSVKRMGLDPLAADAGRRPQNIHGSRPAFARLPSHKIDVLLQELNRSRSIQGGSIRPWWRQRAHFLRRYVLPVQKTLWEANPVTRKLHGMRRGNAEAASGPTYVN